MQQEDRTYIPPSRASRPPQEEERPAGSAPVYTELPFTAPSRTQGTSRAQFTDITPRTPRVPNNGRPSAAYYETGYHPGETRGAQRPAGSVPRQTYANPPRSPYSDYSAYAPRPAANTAPRPTQSTPTTPRPRPNPPRSAATFTEISWDSLRDPSSLTREAAPRPVQSAPAAPTQRTSPMPRTNAPSYTQYAGSDRGRSTPIHEGFDAEWAHGIPERPADMGSGYSDSPRRSASPVGSFDDYYRREVERSRAPSPRTAEPNQPRMTPTRPAAPRTVTPRPGAPRPAEPKSAAPQRSLPSLHLPKITLPEIKNPFGGRKETSSAGTVPPPAQPGAPRHRSTAKKNLPSPIFMIAALVVVALLIFVVAKVAGGKQTYTESRIPPSQSSGVPVYVPPGEQGQPTAVPPTSGIDPSATPLPTVEPSPSPTPSGDKARKENGRIVPADWGPVVIERSKSVYDSHFDKTCMIGNSLVEGFCMWSDMTNIKYIYNTGAVASNVIGTLDLAPLTLNEPDYYDAVYLMFGLNEVGSDVTSFITAYQKIIDYIYQYEPHTTIYVISVTPVTKFVDEDPNEVQSMERIKLFNEALKGMCQECGCWYLDIYSMLLDGEGYLSADYAYAGDGKHFEKSGYKAWAEYMHTHYVDSGLVG